MIIFLPYDNSFECGECLPDKILRQQIFFCRSFINILKDPLNKLRSSPGILMWDGKIRALKKHHNVLLQIACAREIQIRFTDFYEIKGKVNNPYWWGLPELHESHKAGLLRLKTDYLAKGIEAKNKNYFDIAEENFKIYKFLAETTKEWSVNPETPYYWPTKHI